MTLYKFDYYYYYYNKYETEKDRFWFISNPILQSLQSVQEQQAVNRVTRKQCSSLFHLPRYYRRHCSPSPR